MQDAWRAYLELALGLTEASRRKAQQVVRDLAGRGEATASQVQHAVSDLMTTSRENRETMIRLIRYEVDRALGAVGLASAEEVADLTTRVQELERRLRDTPGGQSAPAEQAPAKKTVAKKTGAKKTVAKKTGAKKTVAKKTATKKAANKTA